MFTRLPRKTAIATSQFVVCSVSNSGDWNMAKEPVIHHSYTEALNEAKRLAKYNSGYRFIVLAVAATAQMKPVEDPVQVTYKV